MSKVDCVVADGNVLGESPVWSAREQALYWVDIRAPAVYRFDPLTGVQRTVPLPTCVGSIGLRAAGGLLVALQNGFHTLDLAIGALSLIAHPESHLPENRFNDGRCDRGGRFWAGTMNDTRREPGGSLYRLDADYACTKVLNDVIIPNSIAWSPDDTVMYFADSPRKRIVAYDFSLSDGTISNPRLFVDMRAHPGTPDGSTVDETACVWNAEYRGARVVRYTPQGKIDRVIEMPVSQPTSCCFGGRRLDVLYVTSARQNMTPDELTKQPLAGGLFAINVGVSGLPEAEYAG
jgi:L-arabinonolactonase